MEKKIILISALVLIIAGIILYSQLADTQKQTQFEVNPLLFKIILNKGETVKTTLNVKNLDYEENFSIKVEDLDKIISLEKNNIIIKKGETSQISVNFFGTNDSGGVYIGHISVSNSLKEKKIPVIASIHTAKQFFAINLNAAPESKQLEKKDSLVTEIKFFNLFDTKPHPVRVKYEISDLYGKKIFSDSEEITVGSKSSFTKKFPLPQDIALGDYVFVVSLSYSESITTASYMFSVVNKKQIFSFMNLNLFALIVLIFVVLTFILIVYTLYERHKLLHRLKKQHKLQIKRSKRNILEEMRKHLAKAKDRRQRKKILNEFNDAKKKIIGELKKQQDEQIHELKSLREKKIKYQERKLRQWRKDSYSKALDAAQISRGLKDKLAVLKTAYNEGLIQKESYSKGVSKIKYADRKLKRNVYK